MNKALQSGQPIIERDVGGRQEDGGEHIRYLERLAPEAQEVYGDADNQHAADGVHLGDDGVGEERADVRGEQGEPALYDEHADEARGQAWRGANNYTNVMCTYPDPDIRAMAEKCKAAFDKYGDPTKLAQTEESGILHNLLQDLEKLPTADIDLTPWIDELSYCEEKFLEAVKKRTEADSTRRTGIVKEKRSAAEAAYRTLIDTVVASAIINGEEEYRTFIDHVNAMIERQKAISKARSTRAKKDDEEE